MTASITDLIALAILAVALVGAALTDVRQYLIPNRYPAVIALAYGLFAIGHPLMQGLWSLAAGFLMLVIGAVLMATRVMGGGDVKLLAATTLWAGPWLAQSFLMIVTFAGAALALAWLTPLRRLMPAAPADLASSDSEGLRARFAQPVPYGVAISAGGLYVAAIHVFN
ncbi:MAG TPA: prepilin peptidase [Stellaceae bacterium]|nr:prepilin peptidase [Stellaceae bacterium]